MSRPPRWIDARFAGYGAVDSRFDDRPRIVGVRQAGSRADRVVTGPGVFESAGQSLLQVSDLHVAGLNGVLEVLGMTDARAARADRPEQTQLGRFLWLRCRSAGWWAPSVRAGDAVTAGQSVGTVSSLDGWAVLETIVAPADGVIIFLTSSPAVADDGLLLGLGAS